MTNLQYLIYGMLYGSIGQAIVFLQLQGSVKYGWYDKYPILVLLCAIPSSWMFLKSVQYLIQFFDGEVWPGRFIGFSLGVVVFAIMSHYMFAEPFTQKTMISILLAIGIMATQIFMK